MSRLDNLGDYNVVRDDLYKHGGDVSKLYNSIADTAVAEKTPEIMLKGGLIGGVIILAIDLGTRAVIKSVKYLKNRKKLIDEKPNLERQLVAQVEDVSDLAEGPVEEVDVGIE